MRKKFVASILAVSIATSVTGCAQMGISKEQAGTVIGGIAGLAVGATMGKGNGQIAAALIVAGIGGYIGNRIGQLLDDRDKQALALRTQEVLSQPATPLAQPTAIWRSDHSNASARITPGPEFKAVRTIDVKRTPNIQGVPSMKLINQPYVTRSTLNVRSAPNMNADKVGSLPGNTQFTAVGSTGDWILVGRKGVTVGYVHKDYVMTQSDADTRKRLAAVRFDDMNVSASKETEAFDLGSISSLPSGKTAAETTCRPLSVSLEANGGTTEKQDNTFCRQANDTWELI
ncbi:MULTISPECIES: SH3 domain-containing protein [Pseudomonas syringae group genomosp. 2]|uniref:Putative lipoprotein n=1 Tax=Pseudomonas amygdali pv. ulmi TaxID=251720 RepID=A0A0Q0DL48_PSEA0|nr:SH3 domain-containing protein [Pseudomonas amygdali]MCQ3012006.1 SH3 domain-containing protein [Pseudomonas savastanoi]EGH04012.1 putative lipoprotein [Pseudomonas amygdali pv. aesculi str. 0893_23]KPC56930.1 putative lipoprotein [Pseudomonas amygdali pv. morsprunorum]KPW09873.1 putative lipoprotein [Pseudomonas amygdali pv. aesculi]KPZ08430.1 putative lipoprotein [Pseudomonas amygdali pv. ulmi]